MEFIQTRAKPLTCVTAFCRDANRIMEYVELNLNVVVDVLGRLNDFQFIYAIYGKMQENNVVLLFDIAQKL